PEVFGIIDILFKKEEANEVSSSTNDPKIPEPTELKIFFDELKQAIYSPARFGNIPPEKLTLYKVSIPDGSEAIFESEIKSKMALTVASKKLGNIFKSELLEETIHILVKPPQRVENIKRIVGNSLAPGSEAANNLTKFVKGHSDFELPRTTGIIAGLPRVWLRNQNKPVDNRPNLLFLDLPDPSQVNISAE
ncbi:hypothetical protein BX616_005320, partial [Lobosporangium transversale]